MPVILAALLVIVVILFASVVLIPISLIQRYRAGTMRRQARRWLVTINVIGISLSIFVFLLSAAATNIWIPRAFIFAASGVVAGVALGWFGLAVTRWERVRGALFYTPNRWLVLAVTLAVAARILYGFWRGWQQWQAFGVSDAWFATAGLEGSLAAGATVLGYYFGYWVGVLRRVTRSPTG